MLLGKDIKFTEFHFAQFELSMNPPCYTKVKKSFLLKQLIPREKGSLQEKLQLC